MVKVFQDTDKEFYMDGYLKQILDTAKKEIQKNWDMVFLIDGMEGSGKSVLTMQMAYYCDPTLTVDRIVFNDDDFKKAITEAKPFQAIHYDEAYQGLNSRSAMSKVNKSIVQMLTVIRAKQLFIFIVLPSFFDLDKYVAIWRTRALINVYHTEDFQRGFFKYYSHGDKKKLYLGGKKYYNYSLVRPEFRGHFPDFYPVDKELYKEKKNATAVKFELPKDVRAELIKGMIERFISKNRNISNREFMDILDISETAFYQYIRKIQDPNYKQEKYSYIKGNSRNPP